VKFFSLSGLPRTGSTVLLYILDQNPLFTIGPESELPLILMSNKDYMKTYFHRSQLEREVGVEAFYNFCREGSYAWINHIKKENTFFIDRSKFWVKDLDYYFTLFPSMKVILTIRDLRGIVCSMEKITDSSLFCDQQNLIKDDGMHKLNPREDIQIQRVNNNLALHFIREGLVTLRALTDISKKYKDNIFISKYEDLLTEPHKHLNEIYDFFELPRFQHDLDNIEQNYYNDNVNLPFGIHKIQPKLTKRNETFSEIRKDVREMILRDYSWFYEEYYPELCQST
jgi:sulfotransferase